MSIRRSLGLGYIEATVFNFPSGEDKNPYTGDHNPYSPNYKTRIDDELLQLFLRTMQRRGQSLKRELAKVVPEGNALLEVDPETLFQLQGIQAFQNLKFGFEKEDEAETLKFCVRLVHEIFIQKKHSFTPDLSGDESNQNNGGMNE